MINFRPMVFVIGEALVNLRLGDAGKTLDNRVHGFLVLQEANDVVDTNARVLDACMSAPNAGSSGYISIGFIDRCHEAKLLVSADHRKVVLPCAN